LGGGAIATFKAASTGTLALAGAAAGNYTLAGMTGTVSITAKPLAVAGLTANSKIYDGTSAAMLAGTAVFLASEAAGSGTAVDGKPYSVDAVAPGGTAAGVFADANVGTAKAVSVTGLSVSGAGNGNYSIVQPFSLTANISPRGLTVTANSQSKSYGWSVLFGSGSTQFTSSGLQNGETIGSVTLACDGGVATAPLAGSPYPIAPSAASGGSFSTSNYIISYVPGVLTLTPANYASWASDPVRRLTVGVNDGPLDDPDHDGIPNLLEFVLGGDPLVPSQAVLPVLAKSAGSWTFEYDRSSLSLSSTSQVVEYGSNLTGWDSLPIPATTFVGVTITPGTVSDHVKVTLPAMGAGGFVRLKVSQ